ncbi:hypothetical protein DF048_21900 [Burkholderia seminalis]|nr:hypothetical protein DF048_21900 [Burkholderia seminalis]
MALNAGIESTVDRAMVWVRPGACMPVCQAAAQRRHEMVEIHGRRCVASEVGIRRNRHSIGVTARHVVVRRQTYTREDLLSRYRTGGRRA